MANVYFGLFNDTKKAGLAVGQLKEKGYAKEISVLAHDKKYETSEIHEVKQDVSAGAAVGGTVGAITGVLAGVFSGISSVIVPGIGALVGGPLVTALGVTGGVAGSLGGGILGALVDLGINEPAAELYEREIKKGQVLVGVSTEPNTMDEVLAIFNTYGATDIVTAHR